MQLSCDVTEAEIRLIGLSLSWGKIISSVLHTRALQYFNLFCFITNMADRWDRKKTKIAKCVQVKVSLNECWNIFNEMTAYFALFQHPKKAAMMMHALVVQITSSRQFSFSPSLFFSLSHTLSLPLYLPLYKEPTS